MNIAPIKGKYYEIKSIDSRGMVHVIAKCTGLNYSQDAEPGYMFMNVFRFKGNPEGKSAAGWNMYKINKAYLLNEVNMPNYTYTAIDIDKHPEYRL